MPASLHQLSLYSPVSSFCVALSGGMTLTYAEVADSVTSYSNIQYLGEDGAHYPPGGLPSVLVAGDVAGGDVYRSSIVSFSYLRTAHYTYMDAGAGLFSYHATGNALGLTSLAFSRSGQDTYSLDETGIDAASAIVDSLSTTQTETGGMAGRRVEQPDDLTVNNATYTYSERGEFQHTLTEFGNPDGFGEIDSTSVVINGSGGHTSTFANTGTLIYNGTTSANESASGTLTNADSYGYSSFSSSRALHSSGIETFSFAGQETYSYQAATSLAFDYHTAGLFSGDSFSLTSVLYHDAGASTFTGSRTAQHTYTGSGQSLFSTSGTGVGHNQYGGTTSSGTGTLGAMATTNFNATGTINYTQNSSGSWSHDFVVSGTAANTTYNLSSLVFNRTANTSLSYQYSTNETYTNSAASSYDTDLINNDITSYGGSNGTGVLTVNLSADSNVNSSGTITASTSFESQLTHTVYEAGAFANNSYNLSSVQFNDNARNTYGYDSTRIETANGSSDSEATINASSINTLIYGGELISYAGSRNSDSCRNLDYLSNGTWKHHSDTAESFTANLGGVYVNGSFAFSSVVLRNNGTTTATEDGTSVLSYLATSSANLLMTNQVSAAASVPYIVSQDNHSDSSSLTALATTTGLVSTTINGSSVDYYSYYRAGKFAHGSYSLTSLVLQDAGTSSAVNHEQGNVTTTETGSLPVDLSGLGVLTFTSGGFTARLTNGGTLNVTNGFIASSFASYSADADASTIFSVYREGKWANGSFNLSSFVAGDQGSQTLSDLHQSQSTVTKTEVVAVSGSDSSAATDIFGPESSNSSSSSTMGSVTSFVETSTASVTDDFQGTISTNNYREGTFANGSYNLSSVVLQLDTTVSDSFTSSSTQVYSETGNSSYSIGDTLSDLGSYASTSWHSGGADTASGGESYSINSVDTDTSTANSSGSSSLHEAGQWANGSYSFGSVAYHSQGTNSSTEVGSGTSTFISSDNSTLHSTGTSAAAETLAFLTEGSNSSMSLDLTQSSGSSKVSGSAISGVGSASHNDTYAGEFSNGSYSFSDVELNSQSNSQVTVTQSSLETNSGFTNQSYTTTGSDTGQFSALNTTSAGSNTITTSGHESASFTNRTAISDTTAVTQTSSYSATGNFSGGDYDLTSTARDFASTIADVLNVNSVSTSTAAGTSVSTEVPTNNANSSVGYAQSGSAGSLTLSSAASYSRSEVGVSSLTVQTTATSNGHEAGVYSEGSYALASVVFLDTSTQRQDASDSLTEASSSTNTVSSNSGGSGTDSFALGTSGYSTDQGTGTSGYGTTDRSTDTVILTDSSHSLDTSSLFRAGIFNDGSYTFATTQYQGGGTSSSTSQEVGLHSFSGSGLVSGSSTDTMANLGTFSAANASGQGNEGSVGTTAYSYSGNDNSIANSSNNSSYSDYRAGIWSQGSYALTSVLHQESSIDRFTSAETFTKTSQQTQTANGTGSSSSSLSNNTGFGINSTGSSSSSGTYTMLAQETMTNSAGSLGTSSMYEAGTYGISGWNLGSVLYRDSSTSSYSTTDLLGGTWTGNGNSTVSSLATTTDGAQTGTARTSDTSAFSYTQTSLSTSTASGSSSATDSWAGLWANGSYNFGSAVHDEQSADSSSEVSAATFTQNSTGTWVNDTQGISTSGVNGTFAYSGTSSWTFTDTQSSTGNASVHEVGHFANGSWSLGSSVLNANSLSTSSDQSSGGDSASNTTGYSSNSSFSGSGNGTASLSLHEEGIFANGSWNLGCYLMQGGSQSGSSLTRTGIESAPGENSATTYTSNSTETTGLYAAGQFALGSYSFSSYSQDVQASSNDETTEAGSNAYFGSYARDDSDHSTSELSHVGSGATVSYTQTGTETTTLSFNGTLSGGGTLASTGTVVMDFHGSGSVNVAPGLGGDPQDTAMQALPSANVPNSPDPLPETPDPVSLDNLPDNGGPNGLPAALPNHGGGDTGDGEDFGPGLEGAAIIVTVETEPAAGTGGGSADQAVATAESNGTIEYFPIGMALVINQTCDPEDPNSPGNDEEPPAESPPAPPPNGKYKSRSDYFENSPSPSGPTPNVGSLKPIDSNGVREGRKDFPIPLNDDEAFTWLLQNGYLWTDHPKAKQYVYDDKVAPFDETGRRRKPLLMEGKNGGFINENTYVYRKNGLWVIPCIVCHGRNGDGPLPGLTTADSYVGGQWYHTSGATDIRYFFAGAPSGAIRFAETITNIPYYGLQFADQLYNKEVIAPSSYRKAVDWTNARNSVTEALYPGIDKSSIIFKSGEEFGSEVAAIGATAGLGKGFSSLRGLFSRSTAQMGFVVTQDAGTCFSLQSEIQPAIMRGSLSSRSGFGMTASVGEASLLNASVRNPLNVLNPDFIPNGTQVLQNLTNQQNALLCADLSRATTVLTYEEQLAAAGSPWVARMQYGNALERLVGREIRSDPLLDSIFQWNRGRGPDFMGRGLLQGQTYDITTPRQVGAHLARPYGQGLNVITYQRASGVP
jgi:hypothetical protein